MAKHQGIGKSYLEIFKQIKDNKIAKIYMCVGEEFFLADQFCRLLKESLIQPGMESLDFYKHNFQGEHTFQENFLQNLIETPPFLSKKRLIILKNSGIGQLSSSNLQKFMPLLEKISESICLVFLEEKIDKKQKKFLQLLEKQGEIVDFSKQESKNLLPFLNQLEKKYKVSLTEAQKISLMERTENQMQAMQEEMRKLSFYAHAEKTSTITENVFEELVLPNLNVDVFRFIDQMFDKNFEKAHQSLKTLLLKDKDSMILLLFLLGKQLKQLFYAKSLGQSSEIAKVLKIHPFIAEKLLKQASRFSFGTLFKLYEEIYQMDLYLKTGKVMSENVLDLVLAKWKQEMQSITE